VPGIAQRSLLPANKLRAESREVNPWNPSAPFGGTPMAPRSVLPPGYACLPRLPLLTCRLPERRLPGHCTVMGGKRRKTPARRQRSQSPPRMNANEREWRGQDRTQGIGLAHTIRCAFESSDFFSFHPFLIGVYSRPSAVGLNCSGLGLALTPDSEPRGCYAEGQQARGRRQRRGFRHREISHQDPNRLSIDSKLHPAISTPRDASNSSMSSIPVA
jgi:hypothetical protein